MQAINSVRSTALDFDRVMDRTLDWALEGTRAPAGLIAMYKENRQGLLLLASRGYPAGVERYQSEPWPLTQGIVGRVVRSGEPALVYDVTQDPDYHPIQPATRSQVSVPIKHDPIEGSGSGRGEEQVTGVISLESPEIGAFDERDLDFVRRLADHAAIAIENARLYEKVRDADEAKSEFIDFVAHELRQPMTAVQGYAKMLTMGIGGELTKTQNEFVQVITSNVERMGKLVNDLLEVSRLEAGRTSLQLALVQLDEVIQETIANARTEIDARQHTLTVTIAQDLPKVIGDSDRLGQILTNLVSNAYMYTPDGGSIRISVNSPEADEPPADYLLVSVEDTGIGMSAQDLAKLEEKFFRGDHELVRSQPGSGLGVFITHKLVALHGGELRVESEPGRGSAFRFTVPIAEGNNEQ
jgi:signal transduction histidine kinase